MRYWLLLILIAGPSLSQASYFFSPVGSSEAFLGNAGTALTCSPGSAIYNPAGLGFCEGHLNLSISGTSIAYQEIEGSAFQRETGSLKSSTLLTSAIFSVNDDIHMGFYYAYPTNTQDYLRTQDDNGNTVTQELQRQAALAGISYGGMVDETWAWGFSVGVTWNEMSSDTISNTISAGTLTTLHQKIIESENYLILNPGALWRMNDHYDLGLTLQWRALNLYAEGDSYQNQTSTGQTTINESFHRYTPHTDQIFGMTLGQALHWNEKSILFDVSYAPRYALPTTPSEQKVDLSLFNFSLGWKSPFVMATQLLAGFSYTEIQDQKNYLASLGVSFHKRTFEGNLGVYYQYAKNENVGAVNSDTLGFLYSSTLNY
jgi:hypothetical protein